MRNWVFWPPFIFLVAAVLFSQLYSVSFNEWVSSYNEWILSNFDWIFSAGTFLMVLTCVALLLFKTRNIRIGGMQARPFLTRFQWFSITLCTTIATGILFWGTAEPLYHYSDPPSSLNISPFTNEAAGFSMSTMFLHWSFTPYAIYSIPTLAFALGFYNYRKPFSLSASFFPFFKKKVPNWVNFPVDAVSLFSLVAGMAASMGAGIILLSGGIQLFTGISQSNYINLALGLAIGFTFMFSASTGLMKGIRIFSGINIWFFFFLAGFFLFFSDFNVLWQYFTSGIGIYITDFPEKSLKPLLEHKNTWSRDWTVFYWCNWLAWAPVTAMFLGRISYGYKINEVLFINWIIPSVFAILWMSIFSGNAINFADIHDYKLINILHQKGEGFVIYELFRHFPFTKIISAIFLFTVFISFVTAADSNTEAIGGISSTGIHPDAPSPPLRLKILWGVIIGAISLVMINNAGVEGVKMISNIGGFPILFVMLFIMFGLLLFIIKNLK